MRSQRALSLQQASVQQPLQNRFNAAMDPSQQPQMADNHTITLNDDQNTFLIDAVELEVSDPTELGDTQDAREEQGTGDLKIGRTSLDGVFTEIVYGSYRNGVACRVMFDFTINSDADFRVKAAKLICTVGNDATSTSQVSSSDIVRPRVLKCEPRRLNDDNPTTVGVTATGSLAPNISFERCYDYWRKLHSAENIH
jgi:hypothetical protein